MILDNAQKVIGIELFAASQALYLRGDDKLAPATKAVYNKIRESVAPIHDDIVMYEQMNKFDAMVRRKRSSARPRAFAEPLNDLRRLSKTDNRQH